MQIRWVMTLAGLVAATPFAFAANADRQAGAEQTGHRVDAMALYSQGSAVVQDSRTVKLNKGAQTVNWPLVGAVKPDTLWLAGPGVTLTGFDMAAAHASGGKTQLADRVGQSVTLSTPDGSNRKGTLVGTDGETAYVRVDNRIQRITAASPTQISWLAGPEKQTASDEAPGATLHVNADKAESAKLTATYQTDAPSWQASYTGRFDPQTGKLALSANAVIDNSGHVALDADKAWLVAGDTARTDSQGPRPVMMMAKMAAAPAAAGQAQAVGDVYRYPLAQGLHVAAGATQSVALMAPIKVDAKRQYRFENYALADSGDNRQHADVSLSFDNDSKEPLPGGAVRVYDAGHAAQLMGGTRIDDTPAGAPVQLALGGAFDITGTHRIVKHAKSDDGATTTTVQVKLFNAGKQDAEVAVAERLPSGATLADDAPKTDGGSADQPQWQVKVPANGDKTFTYRFTQPKS